MRALLSSVVMLLATTSYSATPMVAAGADHSLALTRDGSVYAWGDDSYGQLGSGRLLFQSTPLRVTTAPSSQIVGLAAGSYHSLARLQDGGVLAWGENGDGQLGDGTVTSRGTAVRISGLVSIVSLAAGERHSLAADSEGTVWAWGSHENGRLGQGTTEQDRSALPLRVPGLQGAVAVQAGKAHSLALTDNGRVHAWGANVSGQLGIASGQASLTTPTPVVFPVTGVTITAIAAVSDHSFALDSEGRLWSWGENEYYQLGHSSYARSSEPRYLTLLQAQGRVEKFAVGPVGGAAVLEDGSLWVWGFYGRYDSPTRVNGLPGPVQQVQLGESHLVVILRDGRVLSTGDNRLGQLGDGTETSTNELVFVNPRSLTGPLRQLSTGYFHTLALDASGRMMAWGDNTRGQLGIGVAVNSSVPGLVTGLSGVTQIASGQRHVLALLADGSVQAWGDNDELAIGNGREERLFTRPQVISGLPVIRRVAAGGSSSAALDSTGKLWVWGANLRGQLTLSSDVYRINRPTAAVGLPALTEVSVGNEHMLGLDAQGRVWVWGSNGYGQLGDGYNQATTPRMLDSLNDIVAISASGDHSMALDAQGRVWAWGDNGYLQVGPTDQTQVKVPLQVVGLPRIQKIVAGHFGSLALGTDGSLWTWGLGHEGQLGDGTQDTRSQPARAGTDTYVAIGAGVMHHLALRADGLTWAFGLNYSGQLGDGGYANQNTPIGVVDLTLTRFFDADPTVTNTPVAVAKIPPFFTQTLKTGSSRQLTLSARVSLADARLSIPNVRASARAGTNYNLYVVAVLAGSVTQMSGTPTLWARASSGWSPFAAFPIDEYLRGVAANTDGVLLIDILDSTDLSTAVGTKFYVGYGVDATEMLAAGRYRLIYEVQAQ